MERWVDHTHTVIQTAQDLMPAVNAAEATVRDILLNPGAHQLTELHRKAIERIDSIHMVLNNLVDDNRSQQRIINDRISPLISKQKSQWLAEIEASQQHASDIATTSTEPRNAALDSIHAVTRMFIQNERTLMHVRQDSLARSYTVNDIIRWTCLLTIALVCVASISAIRRQQNANVALLNDLANVNASLEQKVLERTQELTQKNKSLGDSLEEIVVLNQQIEQTNVDLNESLQEVKFLYEYAPCGYHTVDSKGYIIKINKTELDWLGYTEEEVIGRSVADFMTAGSLEARRMAIEELKQRGRMEGLEFELVRKDGTTLPVMLNTIAYFDENGNYVKNRSTLFNISDRKLLEEDLKIANQDLRDINEQKNRFLGMVTHDLKNPMSTIAGLLGLIRMTGELNDDQKTYMGMVDASLLRMNNLVAKLLDLNKLEHLQIQANYDVVNVKALVYSVVNNFKTVAEAKKIELIFEVCDHPKVITSDVSLLGQMLDNLVSNAIKFSPHGKRVWLRARPIDGSRVKFEIEDEGPGIAEKDMGKLFEAFQRLSAMPTGGESSTGLGLSIVKALAQVVGTEVTVRSTPGAGTVFSFII